MSTPLEIKKYLFDILDAGRAIEEFTRALTATDFARNRMAQAAVERKFQVIGEALNRIRRLDPGLVESIPEYARIIGFRNIIVHGYDVVDSDIVWDVIATRLPHLLTTVEQLLGQE